MYQFEIDEIWDDIFNDLLEESEFKIHKTDTVSLTISNKLMGTTVFTPDMEEPIRDVKQFDSTLKYALFTIVRNIDVGMNNIDKAACSTVKSAFDVLMRSSTVTKSPRIKAHTAEHFTGMNDSRIKLFSERGDWIRGTFFHLLFFLFYVLGSGWWGRFIEIQGNPYPIFILKKGEGLFNTSMPKLFNLSNVRQICWLSCYINFMSWDQCGEQIY